MHLTFYASSLAALSFATPVNGRAGTPLAAPDTTAPSFRFAAAIAIAGDQLLVGRSGGSARRSAALGGVHVFHRNKSGQWAETAVLTPKDIAADDRFGAALAVDGALLAVGAPGANEGRGAVYIFERDGAGRWTARAKLTAAAGAPNDNLGRAVALRGGLLLAGAPGHADNRGSAVVFRRGADAKTWSEQARLQLPELPAFDTLSRNHRFGRAVTIAEGRLFVGAPGALATTPRELGSSGPGRVVVFHDSAQSWVVEAQITDSSAKDLGAALAASGATLWASSPGRGTVYEFRRDQTGRWSKVADIRPTDPKKMSEFGAAIAFSGRQLFVGAANEDKGSGALYTFHSDSARAPWTEMQRLTAPQATPRWYSFFGQTVAVGDGILAAGTPQPLGGAGDGFALIYHFDSAKAQWRETGAVTDTAWNLGKALTGAVTPCTGGKIKLLLECRNVDVLSYLPGDAIGSTDSGNFFGVLLLTVNSMWGWTDSATGREFALVGLINATSFVEVTDPTNPKYLGKLPLHQGADRSVYREIKVYKNHAYIISDNSGPHGMQVFDLTQLRNVTTTPAVFTETAHYDAFLNAHTLAVNEATGYLYAVMAAGRERCGGQLHMVDVRDPVRPTFVGCYANPKSPGASTHETVCVVYRGPDQQYQGREICLNANGSGLDIVDVTDKQHPTLLSTATYPNVGYAHQAWFTEDQRYVFLNDETDENGKQNTRTIIFDLAQLGDPVVAKEFFGTTTAIDHNLYIRGDYVYQANYTAGLRVLDAKDPKDPHEIGYLDTVPTDNDARFGGAWNNYPYFKSGAVGISSISEGLFLVRLRPPTGR